MSTNDINALRTHLFETLQALKDPKAPMDIDRARAVTQVASTIIDSARVEVEFARVTGQPTGSGFLPQAPALPPGRTTVTPVAGGRVVTHRLRG